MNIMHNTKSQLARLFAVVALMLSVASSASAQDFYVITAGSTNYLAHNAALTGGLTNATSFNATTCLWTINGENIIAIAPDGTQGNKLGYSYSGGGWGGGARTYTLQLSASGGTYDWDNVTSSPSVSYSTGGWGGTTTVYLRYNSGWGMANENTHATVTKVDITDAPYTAGSSTPSYSASLGGDGVIYSTSGTHTYTVDITQVVTYAQTLRTFGTYGTVTVDVPSAVSSAYTGALTDVSWSVSDNAYGATITSGGVLSVTSLPASVDNLTVTYTAQAGGQPVSGTMTVMLAKDEATAEGVAGQATGVTSTTVTLNDYEPHEWAYYNKELGSPIRSWNPANVKITYYGAGKMYTSTTATPSGSLSDVSSSAVRVGILAGETQNTFVYYKTLERTDGTTAADPSGRCEYRTIANPFSVRPTFSSGTTKYYTGFYRWRVKTLEGGAIYDAATDGNSIAVGGTVDAEDVIYFAPSSEYGMTVEFEAVWARAYIGGSTHVTGTNAYERNFYIGAPGGTALTYAATISAVYPDGTDGTNNTLLTAVPNTTQSNAYTCGADTKFEYIHINAANQTFIADNHTLVMGRGISNTTEGNVCVQRIQGIRNATYNTSLNYSLRIETGVYQYLSLTRGTAETGGNTYAISGNNNKVWGIFGSDFDRANTDDNKLRVTDGISNGCNVRYSNNANQQLETSNVTVKSGYYLENQAVTDGSEYESYYLSHDGGNQSYCGQRTLTVEGGNLLGIAGGQDAYNSANNLSLLLRVKGGTFRGSIYGGSAFAAMNGHRRMVFTDGTVKGWIAVGSNGRNATQSGGDLDANAYIYFGGNAEVNSNGNATLINTSLGGNIYGAGCGNAAQPNTGRVANSFVVIADNAYVERNVFGGGNYGWTRYTSDVSVFGDCYVGGKVFGGSNQKGGTDVIVNMTGGTVIEGVYGGSNENGTITDDVNVTVSGGTVGESGIDPETSEVGHVFGSGYGEGTEVTGNVTVTIGAADGMTTHQDNPVINGNVYGGGHAAPYTSTGKTFKVTCQNGKIMGNVFGGGKGATATVTGPTDVLLRGSVLVKGNVFGGGQAAAVNGSTHVQME